jgi:peptide/nickel transport system substrate-binding protein
MIRAGEADLGRWLTAEQCKDLPNCVSGPGIETVFIRLDTQHPALADIRIREAIGLAIDKVTILNDLIGGGTPARQLVGPSALGYNPELQPIPYDPTRAKQLVAEAKAAGVPIEQPLTVYGRAGYVVRVTEIAEAVAQMLQQAGFPGVKISLLENAVFQEVFTAKPIPADRGMIAIHMHGNELMDYAATVSSYYASTGKNATLEDSQVDEMHQKALPLVGAEREKAYQAIAARIASLRHHIPIGHPDFFFGVSQRLQWQTRMDGFLLLKEMSLKA